MGPLGTRKRCGSDGWSDRIPGPHLDLDALMTKEVYARPTMLPPTPVLPENRLTANGERVQEDADLARFRGGTALPLALLAQQTGTATADTGSIHDAQAPIGFSALFLDPKRLPGWTAQHPIRLERKIGSGEAVSFPGGGRGGWGIP